MQCDEIEVYLSGFVDGELPQQQQQRVLTHLERCTACRQVVEELTRIKEETRQLSFQHPTDRDWKQRERHIIQSASRGLGWLILIVWAIVTSGYALYQLATAPHEPLIEKILVFSLFLGLGLLFLSVFSERLRDARTDRYRGVQK